MITLTVYYPTKEFMKFLQQKGFECWIETISGYPNKDGVHEPGEVHVHDYPGNLYDGIIGLSCKWHKAGEVV